MPPLVGPLQAALPHVVRLTTSPPPVPPPVLRPARTHPLSAPRPLEMMLRQPPHLARVARALLSLALVDLALVDLLSVGLVLPREPENTPAVTTPRAPPEVRVLLGPTHGRMPGVPPPQLPAWPPRRLAVPGPLRLGRLAARYLPRALLPAATRPRSCVPGRTSSTGSPVTSA